MRRAEPFSLSIIIALLFIIEPHSALSQETLIGTQERFVTRIDRYTGRTTPISGLGVGGFTNLNSLAYDPSADKLYSVDTLTDQLITIDKSTAQGTVIGQLSFDQVFGIAVDSLTHTLYGVDFNTQQLLIIDKTTAACSVVGPLGFTSWESLAFDPTRNRLYAVERESGGLYSVNLVTGTATLNGVIGFNGIRCLEYHNGLDRLFAVDFNHDLISISPDDASASNIGSLGSSAIILGLAYDSSTNILYGIDDTSNQLLIINPTNATVTFLAPYGFTNVEGLAFDSNTNTLFGVDSFGSGFLLKIDLQAYRGIPIGRIDASPVLGLAFDPNSNALYGTGSVGSDLRRINTTNGDTTFVGSIGTRVEGLAFDPGQSKLYGVSFDNHLLQISTTTGLGTPIGPLGDTGIYGIEFSGGMLYGVNGAKRLVSIDTSTGSVTPVGRTGFYTDGLAESPTAGELIAVDRITHHVVTINTANGSGKAISGLGFRGVIGLAFDENSNLLYSGDADDNVLIQIDPLTWSSFPVGPFGFQNLQALAFKTLDQKLYSIDSNVDELVRLNPQTGASVSIGPINISGTYTGLSFDSAANVFYAVDNSSRKLLTVNPVSGQGSIVGTIGASTGYFGLAFDASANVLYTVDSNSENLIRINPTTGAGTTVGPVGFSFVWGLTFDPIATTLYGADLSTNRLIQINPVTGAGTLIGPTGVSNIWGLAFDASATKLYGIGASTLRLYTFNTSTGAATPIGPYALTIVSGMAFDPGANKLYAVDASSNMLSTVDVTTGSGTAIGLTGLNININSGLAFDSDAGILYVSSFGNLCRLNTTTGAAQNCVGTGSNQLEGLEFDAGVNRLYGTDGASRQLLRVEPNTGQTIPIGSIDIRARGLAGYPDCNENGVPDGADISSGTSVDSNADGLPDECVYFSGGPGSAQWNAAPNWDSSGTPGSSGPPITANDFLTITGAGTMLILGLDAQLSGLRITNGATLSIVDNAHLEVGAGGIILDDGKLTIGDTSSLISGGSILLVDSCTFSPATCFESQLTMSGSGSLVGTVMEALGTSKISVDNSTSISLSGDLRLGGTSSLRPNPNRSDSTTASLNCQNALITGDSSVNADLTLNDSMNMLVRGDLQLRHNTCDGLQVAGGCLPPTLAVLGAAVLTINGSFVLVGPTQITFGDGLGSRVTSYPVSPLRGQSSGQCVIGSNLFNLDDESIIDWSTGRIFLTGIEQTVEVMSEDRGCNSEGFQDNHVIGEIEVASGTTVTFADLRDNVTGDEALYVDQLVLGNDSVARVDGVPVYYHQLTNNGGSINLLNGASLCQVVAAAPPLPIADPTGIVKSRTVSFLPGGGAQEGQVSALGGPSSAIRVFLDSLHHVSPPYTGGASIPFTSFEGQVRWVGPPAQYVESSSNPTPFYSSSLQCTPYYQDWSTVGLLHVTGSAVVPSSVYEVVNVAASCQGNEGACTAVSAPLEVATTRWGDVETPYSPPQPSGQPDFGDISALVNKFKSAPGAPIKARALLAGDDAFGNISPGTMSQDFSFMHISACVDAFRGKSYPYTIESCP